MAVSATAPNGGSMFEVFVMGRDIVCAGMQPAAILPACINW